MCNSAPYDGAFFDRQGAGGHSSAEIILPLLFEHYKPGSIVDVGCGDGPWLKCALTLGVEDIFGIGGKHAVRGRLPIDADRFQAVDLSTRFDLGRRFDLAISVEVAEHLPYGRSETFVADLAALSDVVLFSAALPFQGGVNHINEQWPEFWAILFRRHGYVACDFLRPRLWTRPEVDFRYAQNLLLFCRRDRASELFSPEVVADGRPLSLPHPLTFLANVARYRPLAAEALDFEYEDYLALLKAHLAGDTLLPPLRAPGALSRQSGMALFPSARTAIADVRAELNGKDREIARLNDALAARENELRRAAADLDESRRTVKTLRQSWSWRCTAPLRAAADLGLPIRRLIRGPGRGVSLRSKLLGLLQWYWFGPQVRASGLFDERYYLDHHPGVAPSRGDPLRHFFVFGAAQALNPHPLFDLRYYFGRNPDLAKSSINPLVHYLKWGASEGRDPHPAFDTSFYLDRNPEVRKAGLNPLAHYMGPGVAQGLDPNPWFDTSEYLDRNPHAALKGVNPLLHHLSGHGLRVAPAAAAPTESGGLPPGVHVDPRTTQLRARLRADYQLSGRPPLDSDYDSIPLVSVLIPCYNYGYYLEDAILSAMMACSYPMEIVVVDDGSTDEGSIAAVAELAERYRFRLMRQSNMGQSGARYKGVCGSRGKFIQFLDADDLLAPGKIDRQADMLTAEAGIDIAVCEYELCDADGGDRRLMEPSTLAGYALSAEDFLIRWERGFSLPIHCALFRREALDKEQFQRITKVGMEDWIFWIVVAAGSPRFQFHPEVLATYRIHGHNTCANREGLGLDFLRACMYVLQARLNTCDNFLEESIDHFCRAYLGSIKREAIVWSRTHAVE